MHNATKTTFDQLRSNEFAGGVVKYFVYNFNGMELNAHSQDCLDIALDNYKAMREARVPEVANGLQLLAIGEVVSQPSSQPPISPWTKPFVTF